MPSLRRSTLAPKAGYDETGLPGILGPTTRGWSAGGGTALVSGTTYLYRIVPARDYSIALAWYSVTTASGTDDPIEIAVLNADCTTKLGSTGVLTGQLNTTGDRTPGLTARLTAGVPYQVAIQATSTASLRFIQWNSASVAVAFGQSMAKYLAMQKAGQTLPVAAPITGAAGVGGVPLICLREV